jgi:hypothetical protein
MPRTFRYLLPAVLGSLLAAPAAGQLLGPSFSVGMTVPARSEADTHGTGLHVGAALKLPLFPVQFEGALDRMGADDDADEDLTVWSAGVALPITLTPPLLPLGIYVIPGAGMYRHDGGTDTGVSAGAGARVGIGVLVWAEDNKLTWLNASVGLRF